MRCITVEKNRAWQCVDEPTTAWAGVCRVSDKTFGRDAELAVIRGAVADVAGAIGGRLVLGGPPGIGKSHLLRVATDLARRADVCVAFRVAFELDRAAPLVTLASALRASQPRTDAFAWLYEPRTAADNPYQTIERIRETIEEFAAVRPLLIAIDDAQWMDELSALAVRELVPALIASPVYWMFTCRSVAADSPGERVVAWLLREGATEVTLGKLDDPAVARLCADVVGAEVDNTVLALAAGCGGSPFQVEQLLKRLRVTNQLVINNRIATVTGEDLPDGYIATVQGLVDQLPGEVRWLLRAGSVFGRPFSPGEVARLMEGSSAEPLLLADAAVAAGVLTYQGRALTFAHDLMRQAVYGSLNDPTRATLHARAAVVTRADGRSPVEVAEHLLRSGHSGAREAVAMLREAAEQVAPLAPRTAADLIVRALETAGEYDPDRAALAALAVGFLAAVGRVTQAREFGEAALCAGIGSQVGATLLLGLAEAFKHAGQNQISIEYADRALAHPQVTPGVRAKLFAVRAHASFYAGDLDMADACGAAATEAGEGAGEFGAWVFGLAARSLVAQARGELDDSLAYAREAVDIADREGGEAVQRHPRIWLANALLTMDRYDEAAAVLRAGRRLSQDLGTAWSAPLWHHFSTLQMMAQGRLDDAAAEAEAGVATAETLTAYSLAIPLLGSLARLAVARESLADAREFLLRMRHLTESGITVAPEDVAWAEATVLEAEGNPEAAWQSLRDLCDCLSERPGMVAQDPEAALLLVRVAVKVDEPDGAATVARTLRTLADRFPTVWSLVAAADHADGLLRGDAALLDRAVGSWRRAPRRRALAVALADAANLVAGGAGPPADARRQEALKIAAECGDLRMVQSLEGLLAGRVPVQAPTGCLPALSGAERRVALLIAEGKSNKEVASKLFLSVHTVDSHLRNIFRKLGIHGRVQLTAIVTRECGPIP